MVVVIGEWDIIVTSAGTLLPLALALDMVGEALITVVGEVLTTVVGVIHITVEVMAGDIHITGMGTTTEEMFHTLATQEQHQMVTETYLQTQEAAII